MAKALINGEVLRWARERAGMPYEVLAEKLAQRPDRLLQWEAGEEQPTFKQAQALAQAVHVPFGYFFLKEPPREELPIPDLRTVGDGERLDFDVNSRALISDVLFKHDWYRELLEFEGVKRREFVEKFQVTADVALVAEDMRAVLSVNIDKARQARNWEVHLRDLMSAADQAGIWVMRSGIVGSNTHRPLNVGQFRGFAISDPVAPLVFINGRDAKAAQIFTLAHELAHIWFGQSGISNVDIGRTDRHEHRRIEKACNAVAAEFLTPSDAFRAHWSPAQRFEQNLESAAQRFKVSRVVAARRAFDLQLIDRDAYGAFFALERRKWDQDKEDGGSGGNFYNTLPIRNGERFTKSVVGRAMSGQLLLREAAQLLNTQPNSIVALQRRARG